MTDTLTFVFGPFSFVPARHALLQGGVPVRIGGRALDLLAALVERPGELVSKRELMARAWPASVVDEANIKVHIAALRRVLADDGETERYIATVAGRGYRFVAPIETRQTTEPSSSLESRLWNRMVGPDGQSTF